jgi:hypothetical protein
MFCCVVAEVCCVQATIFGAVRAAAGNINVYDIRLPCKGALCYDFSKMRRYLAQPAVQEALGVTGRPWNECNPSVYGDFLADWMLEARPSLLPAPFAVGHGGGLPYPVTPAAHAWIACVRSGTLARRRCMAYGTRRCMQHATRRCMQYATLLPEMLADGVRVMIYAGDQDLICNWLGNRRWVDAMKWQGSAEWAQAKEHEWTVSGAPAGRVTHAQGLTFVKVYNAGHMVRSARACALPRACALRAACLAARALAQGAAQRAGAMAVCARQGLVQSLRVLQVPMDQAENGLDMIQRFTRNSEFETADSAQWASITLRGSSVLAVQK